MAATKVEIADWFKRGVAQGATHMIVVCDTYDHDDYPVYVMPNENVHEKQKEYNGQNMQRVMEVYSMSMDMNTQLNQFRSFNY